MVYVDDERAIYEGTRWLIQERGHRKLGYFGVPTVLPPARGRLRGFTCAMEDANLPVDPRFIREGDFSLESGRAAAQALVKDRELPTALVVINDLMAIGTILALQEAGYRVPEDVAVLGFDDIPEATIVRPTLTTIAQYPRDIGEKLALALFERLENPSINARRKFESSYKLIPRQST